MKRNQVALFLPRSVPKLIVYGRHFVLALTNNARFPSPTLPLAIVTSDLDALEVAEVAAQSRTRGAVAERDIKRRKVEDDLAILRAYVEGVAIQNPEQAAAIIASAGLSVKQYARGAKPELDVAMGPNAGEVVVRARALKRFAAYEWQMSSDGGNAWTALGTTTVASTAVPDLTAGSTYAFRFRTTVKRTTSDWSQQVDFIVH